MTGRVTDKVTDKERALLRLLDKDPGYTSAQLVDKLAVSRKTLALIIKSLKEKGIIERIGSDRKGYWKINTEL